MDTLSSTMKVSFGMSTAAALEMGGSQAFSPESISVTNKLTFGTDDSEGNEAFADKRSLIASAGESLNVFDGALVNTDGGVLSLTSIRQLFIKNHRTDGSIYLGTGAATANEWNGPQAAAGTLEIPAGQTLPLHKAEGWAVDGTHKLVHVRNSAGAPADYTIFIVGLT